MNLENAKAMAITPKIAPVATVAPLDITFFDVMQSARFATNSRIAPINVNVTTS